MLFSAWLSIQNCPRWRDQLTAVEFQYSLKFQIPTDVSVMRLPYCKRENDIVVYLHKNNTAYKLKKDLRK